MSSKVESAESDSDDFSRGLLLHDIEEISKALYLDRNPRKAFNSFSGHRPYVTGKTGVWESNSGVIIEDILHKDKKSSIWNWKPLKALTHIGNSQFNCCFFLHVHSIEGLLPNFNNLNLCVTWKRKTDMLRTRPVRVCSGMAEFEETLMHRCTVYGSRNGSNSSAKYEPRLFLLRASVVEEPMIDIGNHWIDLSRLLPLRLEDLLGDNRSSGKWTTSFKLTGKARGAMLNVSLGFSMMSGSESAYEPGFFVKVPHIVRDDKLNHFADFGSSRTSSSARISTEESSSRSGSVDVNFLEGIFPNQGSELSHSVTLLYQKLNEAKKGNLLESDSHYESTDSSVVKTGPNVNETEFDSVEAVELCLLDEMETEKSGSQRFDSSVIETIDVTELFKEEETSLLEPVDWDLKIDDIKHDEHDRATSDSEDQENSRCFIEPAFEEFDLAFCDGPDPLLDISKDYDQESYIRTQSSYKAGRSTRSHSLDDIAESIENDFLNMLNFDQSEYGTFCGGSSRRVTFADDLDLSLAIQAAEKNHSSLNQSLKSDRNPKMLEDLETEALMHEWGLDEEAFQYSPRANSGGFGSPVYLPAQEPLKLPSIEEGVGPIIWTKDGGLLRSMNPLVFRNACNGARLIVQASAPIVLPKAMGFRVMEILQSWASGGVEKMCSLANDLIPFEDVTGKTMQQLLSEGESRSVAFKSRALQHESVAVVSEYVAFEDLIPLAITNIEGLLVEGLKIQSGMADQEAPSSVRTKSQIVDELVKASVPLEEWVKLDSEDSYVEGETDDNILRHLEAYCAKLVEPRCENHGVFHNNFTMGLKLQLRDPLRDYEMVGPTMLALIQVEKEVCKGENDVLDENISSEETKCFGQKQQKNCEPQFKVLEAHLAGLNGNNKQLWGSSRQQQSGSRWLHSSGMAKPNKNLVSNSNAIIKVRSGLMKKASPEDVLWSISSSGQSEGATWNDQVALNVHVRNPDILFPSECVK